MRRICLLAVVLVSTLCASCLFASWPAAAQSCTSDFQCSPSLISQNTCLGDTLVMRRSICVAGTCQTQEMGRTSCGGGSVGSCQGNTFVRSGGRCDALAGRCVQGGQSAVACVKACSCQGNSLAIATGTCSPGAGCGRAVLRCKAGCTCSPEPRCLEDPEPKAKAKKAPAKAEKGKAPETADKNKDKS